MDIEQQAERIAAGARLASQYLGDCGGAAANGVGGGHPPQQAATSSGAFHVACPYTGNAQCFCPQGAGMSGMSQQQQASAAANARQTYDIWMGAAAPNTIPQAAPPDMRQHPAGQAPTEILIPRLYRNPQSMDIGTETPVLIRGEYITRQQALGRLEQCALEARKLAAEAVRLALHAGIDWKPPPEIGVDPAQFPRPSDLDVLKKLASGAYVQAVKEGRLTPSEEQQLLRLTEDGYKALSGLRAAAGQTQPASNGSALAQHSGPLETTQKKPAILKIKDIKPSLKGEDVLVRSNSEDKIWHHAKITEVDIKKRTGVLSFPKMSQAVSVDLGELIKNKQISWARADQGDNAAPTAEGTQNTSQSAPQAPQAKAAPDNSQIPQQSVPQRQQQNQPAAMPVVNTMHGNQGMYGFSVQQQQQQSAPQQLLPDNSLQQRSANSNSPSVVEYLLANGPSAIGKVVEVTLIATGQQRVGQISNVSQNPKFLAIHLGNLTATVKAEDEFKLYTLRLMDR